MLLALLSLLPAQELELAPPTPFDSVVPLVIDAEDPLLAGHGRAERVEYTVEFSGTLHVWTSVEGEADLFLRVEEEDGALSAEDDDSGGGKTPYVKLEVEPGRPLWIFVASSKEPGADALDDATVRVELHLVAAPETAQTRSAAKRASQEIAEVRKLRAANDLDSARERAVQVLDELLAVPGAEASELIAARAWELGYETYGLSLLSPTERAGRRAWRHRSRTLPDDHPELQKTRAYLAWTIKALGDLEGARILQEKVLEVRSRTLPDEHPDVQVTRGNLALIIKALGDLEGARVLQEKVLEVFSRTLPDDHSRVQAARGNLAWTIGALGDLEGARVLQERVLEVCLRTLPDDHPELQRARGNLAGTIRAQGDLEGARALQEKVLEVRSRTLPDDHPDLQVARGNFAGTIKALGDLERARALEEKVLEVFSHTLPDEHPNLQKSRGNLAWTIKTLGDLEGARALQEKVLEVFSRTLPDDHPDLQAARGNLAGTIRDLGDFEGARTLQEKVLEVRSRALPDDHPDLQGARGNLASTIGVLGDLERARALQEAVLEVYSRTLPDDHPYLQMARGNLAHILAMQSSPGRESFGGKGTENEGARERGRERCAALIQALCRARLRSAREALLTSSSREAEERCARLAETLGLSLSFAGGYGVFEPIAELEHESFALSEATRGAALGSAALMRAAAGSPRYGTLLASLRRASDELAGRAQRGMTSDEFQRALMRREDVERELVQLARELSGGTPGMIELDVEALAAGLGKSEALVGYRRYERSHLEEDEERAIREESVESLCAFVLRRGRVESGSDHERAADVLVRVELGPIAPIEEAVRAWRRAIGAGVERGVGADASEPDVVRARGADLRRLVLDPLLPSLEGVDHIVLALDDVLHLVPLDALPADGAASESAGRPELVGERWRIETRATLTELFGERPRRMETGPLIALGGASFNSEPAGLGDADLAVIEAGTASSAELAAPEKLASILRGGAWERGFAPLTYTGLEVREIVALHEEVFEDAGGALVLEKRKASRETLEELAPRARWLHVATHGWFASESIRSWSDPEPLDKLSGLGMRLSGEEQVRGMSPMLLCGLALAGANLPEDELGRVPGLLTAEELSALDLTNCELAVLSACDTKVGERRAGQGVASLQRALQMAGARSVITSLWKVPDEATRELMLDFYRRLWVEEKPKAQALWEAKMRLRDAVDERGKPRYTTRDWAAWVLTGEPD